METEVPEKNQEEIPGNNSGWDNRILCSDGNCIGVIGSDGRCKECGKKYEGDLSTLNSFEDDDQPVVEEADVSPGTTELPEVADAPVDEEWEDRVLCSDGNCIGIIGTDGKCKECGKPSE